MKPLRTSCLARGFTLIELMLTLAVAAVLLLVAAPNFVSFQRNSELTSLANKLVGAINSARGEAMKTGRNAYVIPLNSSDWAEGWRVYVDLNGNDVYDAGTDTLMLSEPAVPSYMTITGNNGAAISTTPVPHIGFNGSGFAQSIGNKTLANLSLVIKRNDTSASNADSETRLVIVARTGRTRACKKSANCTSSSTE